MPLARREGLPEGAAGARGVGRQVGARHEGPERVLEARAEHGKHAAGFAMEPAPEAHDLRVAGARLCESQRRLDGFGTARIELRAIQVAGGELGDQLHERGAMLRREAPHVNPRDLSLHGRDVLRMGVPDAGDPDSREQIHVAVAVHVVQHRTVPVIDRELAEERHALSARGQIQRLGVEQGLRLRPGDLEPTQRMRHARHRWRIVG